MSLFGGLFGGDEEDQKPAESAPEGTGEGKQDILTDVGAGVGNLFGSFMSMAQEVGSVVKENAEAVVTTGGIPLIGDFQREQSKFISEKKGGQASALPPWEGYENEETLREQVLVLSTDKRNFLRDPPAGQTAFKFDYAKESAVAMVMLQEDPNLPKMRFALVPKDMSEDRFWRNYFYRVYLMKQTFAVSALASTADEERDQPAPAAAEPPTPTAAPPTASQVESPDTLNETTGLDDDAFESPATDAPKMAEVNLADLGGDVDDEVSFGAGAASTATTPVASGDTVGLDSSKLDSKLSSSNPSSGGEGTSDNSWDKADIETETDMSEFELLKEGADVELEDGWEDEVNAMLEEEEEEGDAP